MSKLGAHICCLHVLRDMQRVKVQLWKTFCIRFCAKQGRRSISRLMLIHT